MGDGEIVILLYNQFFGVWPPVPDRCPTPCRFTTDRAAAPEADAVVFHIPTFRSFVGLRKPAGQLWVAWSMESPINVRRLAKPGFMARFDLTMTYERSSDVWCPYFSPATMPPSLGMVPFDLGPATSASASRPVVYLQRNKRDRSARIPYVAELMTRVAVDSFGRVLRNRPEVIPPGWRARHDLYSRYKFTLACENSYAPDYVTEKFFDPLVAGSVPVYRGTGDVAALAPAPGCYVDAADFRSARELGAFLDHLAHHDDEYQAYQSWRENDVSPGFQAHLERLRQPLLCRLAAAVAERIGMPLTS